MTNLTPFAEAQSRTGLSTQYQSGASSGGLGDESSAQQTRLVLSGYPSHFTEQDLSQLMNELMKSYGFLLPGTYSAVKSIHTSSANEREAFVEVILRLVIFLVSIYVFLGSLRRLNRRVKHWLLTVMPMTILY